MGSDDKTNSATQGVRLFVKAAAQTPQMQGVNAQSQPNASTGQNQQQQRSVSGGCPVIHQGQSPAAYAGGCPVVGVNPGNQMPPSANNPLPGQHKPLSTWRQNSTIPMSENSPAPPHQPETTQNSQGVKHNNWVYPSEQMFYNAMKRKGWEPTEDDMTAVVAIHNAVNERAWSEIRHWEAATGDCEACGRGPRLVRFQGRPNDYTPKARLLNFLGYKLPFDRHDWIVDRCGTEVRYVIDFYNAAPQPGMPNAMHLDVRPALDSPKALWERVRMQWHWVSSKRWLNE